MTRHDDDRWRAILAGEDPTREEMARAEAELRAMPPAEPLPAQKIEQLVARAVEPPPAEVLHMPRRQAGRRLLLAAALVLSVGSIAWYARVLFESGRNSLDAMHYAEAVRLTGEPGYSDQKRASGLLFIASKCQPIADLLGRLTTDPDPQVASRARRIRGETLALLREDVTPPTLRDFPPGDIADYIPIAGDSGRDTGERLDALDQLARLLAIGVRAVATCKYETEYGLANRTVFADRLRGALVE